MIEAMVCRDPDAAMDAMHVHLERLSVSIVGTTDPLLAREELVGRRACDRVQG